MIIARDAFSIVETVSGNPPPNPRQRGTLGNATLRRAIFLAFIFAFAVFPARSQQAEVVKIGLLIQDKASQAAKQGAELAIKMANERMPGGPQFQLITKNMEGPWGTGSKQAIDLIFEHKVWALLGSHDGRNAHLVEQAATKSTVVFLSAWSSDPSLSQAFVPWFFNCVPNDEQQADQLIEEIYSQRKFTRVSVISDNAYDSNQALNSFLKRLKLSGKKEPVKYSFDKYSPELNNLADQLIATKPDCIILFCQPSAALKIVRLMQQRKIGQPLYGSLFILDENRLSEEELHEFDSRIQVTSWAWNANKNRIFGQEFRKLYGKMPGMVAAYAFDGMNLLIEAIRISQSPDVDKIQQALCKIRHEGVTGLIRFDNKGNREGDMNVMKILNGLPVTAGKD